VNYGHALCNQLTVLLAFNEGAGVPNVATSRTYRRPTIDAADYYWVKKQKKRGSVFVPSPALVLANATLTVGDNRPLCPIADGTIAISVSDLVADPDYGAFASGADVCAVHLPYTDGNIYFDFAGSSEGSTRLSVAFPGDGFYVFTVGQRGMEIWRDANLIASNSGHPARNGTTAGNLTIGGGIEPAEVYEYFAMWRRQLSQHDIKSLYASPFQMFEPSPVEQFAAFATAGGGGASALRQRTLTGIGG